MDALGKGVTENVISVRQLKLLVDFKNNGEIIRYLRKRGFVLHDSRVNYNGINHTIWFRGISKKKVVKTFRKSMED